MVEEVPKNINTEIVTRVNIVILKTFADHVTSKIWMNKSILLFLNCLTKIIIIKDLRIRCNISLVFYWCRNVSCARVLCFSGILIWSYKVYPPQVNDFPNYFSSPKKVESVTKNASKKGENGSKCNWACNDFPHREYKYPQIT